MLEVTKRFFPFTKSILIQYKLHPMQFLKEHLPGNYCNWQTPIKHDKLTSSPNRRRFDPANGNQLLYIINFFGFSVGQLSIDDGLRIESLIAVGFPWN